MNPRIIVKNVAYNLAVLEPLALLLFTVWGVHWAYGYLSAAPKIALGSMIEAEEFQVVGKSKDFSVEHQSTKNFTGGTWRGDDQLLMVAPEQNDWIEWRLNVTAVGRYRISAYLTKADDYAVVRFLINGNRLGDDVDLWSDRGIVETGKIVLGEFTASNGPVLLRAETVGANQNNKTTHHYFGIDGFLIEKL